MSARDELADILMSDAVMYAEGNGRNYALSEADAILAAGYRKPRTITTAEELHALPIGAIILDGDPDCCKKNTNGRWISMNEPDESFSSSSIVDSLPAVLIYEPEPQP